MNNWDEDPNSDSAKETPYLEAIQLAKDGKYESAIKKLEKLDGYKNLMRYQLHVMSVYWQRNIHQQ